MGGGWGVLLVMMVVMVVVGRALYSPLLGLGTEGGERSWWCDALHVSVAAEAAHTGTIERLEVDCGHLHR